VKYVLVVALLFVMAVPVLAADTIDSLKTQVDQLTATLNAVSAQLAEVTARLAEVEACVPPPVVTGEGSVKPAPKCWYDSLTINGYWQGRYEAREDTADDFTLRQAYLNFIAKPNPRTMGVVTLVRTGPLEPQIDICNAFVQYKLDDMWTISAGQLLTNFGYEVNQGSSARLPLERWAAAEGISTRTDRPGLPGMYFKGPWDRGFAISRAQDGDAPAISLAIINGNFRDADNNTAKTVEASMKWQQSWGQFGASYVNGKLNDPATGLIEQDREAICLFVHTDPTPWGFQAEWLEGRLFDQDVEGWYGMVSKKTGPKATAFVRYETYDPNTDSVGNTFNAWHYGLAYQLDANNELTVQYTDAGGDTCGGYDMFGLQWQNGF